MDPSAHTRQIGNLVEEMSTTKCLQQARFFVTIVALMIVPVCAVGAQDFVDHTIKFTPSALVHGWKAFDIRKWQEGTVSGVYYEFGRNGYGSFRRPGAYQKDQWSARCGQDAMDDYRWCSISKGDLRITYFDTDELRVRIGRDHYPGTSVRIRIDGDKPISASKNGWSGNSAKRIIDRLIASRQVTTRYQEWPYKNYKDTIINLFGLGVAYEYVKWAVHGQRKDSPATSSNSSRKNKSALVRQIQKILLEMGYYEGKVDGLYGPQTKRAIEHYEQDRRLTITGKATQELFADINAQAAEAGQFSKEQVCKAGIAVVMGRDPAIMNTDRVQNDVIYISYTRVNDGTHWAYKCKLAGNRIIWGNDNGRWRTHEADSKIIFNVKGDVINVEDRFSDGSSSKKSFTLNQIPK